MPSKPPPPIYVAVCLTKDENGTIETIGLRELQDTRIQPPTDHEPKSTVVHWIGVFGYTVYTLQEKDCKLYLGKMLHVVRKSDGTQYLSTDPNESKSDNLGFTPECPRGSHGVLAYGYDAKVPPGLGPLIAV